MGEESKFWPFDCDPEGEIYENPSWDLPGRRKARREIVKKQRVAAHKFRAAL